MIYPFYVILLGLQRLFLFCNTYQKNFYGSNLTGTKRKLSYSLVYSHWDYFTLKQLLTQKLLFHVEIHTCEIGESQK